MSLSTTQFHQMGTTSEGNCQTYSPLGTCLKKHFDRDALVKAATGTTSHNGVTYSTTAQTLTGVMPAGSNGVNHGNPVSYNFLKVSNIRHTGIAVDGNAVLLTVTIQ